MAYDDPECVNFAITGDTILWKGDPFAKLIPADPVKGISHVEQYAAIKALHNAAERVLCVCPQCDRNYNADEDGDT